jgi:hypothetical protein
MAKAEASVEELVGLVGIIKMNCACRKCSAMTSSTMYNKMSRRWRKLLRCRSKPIERRHGKEVGSIFQGENTEQEESD